ncbi:MAG: VanZ family protein [Anaerolineales bacterium]|nr:VanZ family protein [Chloroflexota bacterium]MBL6980934.1 VanZ family protein [Anaerolineales bacterium]
MRRWRYLWLLLWLVGILFPMAWLGNFSEKFQQMFNTLFSPEWMHWIMHALLYAALAVLIMIVFERPLTKSSLGLVLVTTLIVGGLQEGWQVLSGVQILRWNTVFDLGVDMLGALIGFGLSYWLRTKSRAYCASK